MMAETKPCPNCGTPLSADAPVGLCPACLLVEGIGPSVVPNAANGSATKVYPSRASAPSIQELQPLFPELEIIELLGQGGMGAVYKVRQKNLDRLAALKILPRDAGQDDAFAERFAREARTLARLMHPNIVTVFEFGERQGIFFLVMEYVDGVNLRQAMRTKALTPQQALTIVPQICDALQYAHEERVVHRDIKPENVLLDKRGRVKIADFGLAKLLSRTRVDVTLTAAHQVLGTLHYMAPEQIEHPLDVDHRADIYSLGVVLYELLTGDLPLGRFALPSEKADVSRQLDEVVLKALERRPEMRYQRASEVRTAVESAGTAAPSRMPGMPQVAPLLGKLFAAPSNGLIGPDPGAMIGGAILVGLGILTAPFGLTTNTSSYFWAGVVSLGIGIQWFAKAYADERRQAAMRRPDGPDMTILTTGAPLTVAGFVLLIVGMITGSGILFWVSFAMVASGASYLWRCWVFDEETGDDGKVRDQSGPVGQPNAEPMASYSLPEKPLARETDDVRKWVARPATGLLVAAMLNLIPVPLMLIAAAVTFGYPTQSVPRVTQSVIVLENQDQISPPSPPNAPRAPMVPQPPAVPFAPRPQESFGRVVPIFPVAILAGAAIIHVPIALLLGIASYRMRRLESHGLAIMASVVAMIPCQLGVLVGFPAGLWSLLVLMKPEVKREFGRGPTANGGISGNTSWV